MDGTLGVDEELPLQLGASTGCLRREVEDLPDLHLLEMTTADQ
jgi:hypothetical protein